MEKQKIIINGKEYTGRGVFACVFDDNGVRAITMGGFSATALAIISNEANKNYKSAVPPIVRSLLDSSIEACDPDISIESCDSYLKMESELAVAEAEKILRESLGGWK